MVFRIRSKSKGRNGGTWAVDEAMIPGDVSRRESGKKAGSRELKEKPAMPGKPNVLISLNSRLR